MTEQESNKIVSENLNYVKAVANEFKGKGLEYEDLVSEGTIAMLMAARKFDTNRGTRFVAYAGPIIRKAMQQAIEKQGNIYRMPKDVKKHAPRNVEKAVSVDAPLNAGNQYTLLDILTNKDVEMADEGLKIQKIRKEINDVIKFLNEREQAVIKKFYGIGEPHETMAEIAKDLGLKRERVRQIRDRASRKLNKNLRYRQVKGLLKD